ncbi:arginine--tRNA ligase [Phocea massiliensis]|uniref:Arginine--tRNA ligase n=1 Tax=Merdimmobilis hominis TaxID=2897707 RepID=A0A939BEN5_9FIRM|nr:arginine--tRNA ligase [Merdimmobilis hominis]MBM6921086.1 arginine--tRNA ligase [Merdimmobilis hominis]
MNNPIAQAKAQIRELLLGALGRLTAAGTFEAVPVPDFTVEIPADPKNGDFAANLAMVSAKAFHMAPRKIAEAIASEMNMTGTMFDRMEIAGPGFLNFYLNDRFYADVLREIESAGKDYGRTDFGKKKRVMVEFVSANPTGPMHIGNARGGAIGDSLASVLDWAGYDVTREFYVNDAGNQINKFGLSLSVRYQQVFKGEDAVELPADAYQGKDILEHAKKFAEIYGDKYLDCDEETRRAALVNYALPLNIEALKNDLAKYRIFYDVWFLESTLHESGEVMKSVERLTENGYTYEKDGTIFYKATAFGAEKDDVLVRANGVPTYFAADIAYHYNKFAVRGFDKVINIWGADHHGHVARLKGAMDAIGLDGNKLDIVLMQLVKLMRDGQPVKVSKRTGKSITLVDLLEEVPIDAARFFFNLREANSQMDFDLDLAVEESSKNPVYYVQYAHARICSILRTLESESITPKAMCENDLSVLSADEEKMLIRFLAKLPQEIIDAANDYDPARITRYAIDLATLFHKFYNACRVKCGDDCTMHARLALCVAVKTVLGNVLSLLKIDAPESM